MTISPPQAGQLNWADDLNTILLDLDSRLSSVEPGGIISNRVLKNTSEVVQTVTTVLDGTVLVDATYGDVIAFTGGASDNFSINLLQEIPVGRTKTITALVYNGTTPFLLEEVFVDTVSANLLWMGANGAPTSGTANGVDAYSITFVNTGVINALVSWVPYKA